MISVLDGTGAPGKSVLEGGELTTLLTAIVTAIANAAAATQPISATALPLPTNAATDAKVEAVRALLAGTLMFALPNGAATAAKQDGLQTSIDRTTPADVVSAITPSDTVDLAIVPKALLVTASGTLSIKDSAGTTVSLGSPPLGAVLPIRARRVMATGTTATVVGLS